MKAISLVRYTKSPQGYADFQELVHAIRDRYPYALPTTVVAGLITKGTIALVHEPAGAGIKRVEFRYTHEGTVRQGETPVWLDSREALDFLRGIAQPT